MAYTTENILVFPNNGTAATLVYHPSSVRIIVYFWYAKRLLLFQLTCTDNFWPYWWKRSIIRIIGSIIITRKTCMPQISRNWNVTPFTHPLPVSVTQPNSLITWGWGFSFFITSSSDRRSFLSEAGAFAKKNSNGRSNGN